MLSEIDNFGGHADEMSYRVQILHALRQEAMELRNVETDYALNILQYNQELIEEIQKVMSELATQNEAMLMRQIHKRTLLASQLGGVPVSSALSQLQTLQTLAATSQQLQNSLNSSLPASPFLGGLGASSPNPFGSRLNGSQNNTFKSLGGKINSPTLLPSNRFVIPSSPGSTPSPTSPTIRSVSPQTESSKETSPSNSQNQGTNFIIKPSWKPKHLKAEENSVFLDDATSVGYGFVGYQLVALIEELREVAEDKELNNVTAEERLNQTLEVLKLLKDLLHIKEIMPLERLQAIARDPDSLLEHERDTYYYSVLMTYLNIAPNKHGMKAEHLLWSQDKVRHYIDETRISHIWKEICPLKEWIFHKSLEKKQGKRLKKDESSSPSRPEKRTQYQNWPAVVFPLLLKDHFLSKIRKHHPGLPEPGVVNNAVLAHRRLKRDQERFRMQAAKI